jgi:hypothetical protein
MTRWPGNERYVVQGGDWGRSLQSDAHGILSDRCLAVRKPAVRLSRRQEVLDQAADRRKPASEF